jgi:hypothetical protein
MKLCLGIDGGLNRSNQAIKTLSELNYQEDNKHNKLAQTLTKIRDLLNLL